MGILTEDMKRLVSEQRLGFVATVCPDGTPNLSPKGTTAVWDDDHIVFADIRSPATVSNLRRNPSTEINVVDPMVRKGYRFKGVASVVTEGALFERILDLRNDVGLLSEEYNVRLQRQTGNFPQAFSHVALVNTAHNLTSKLSPVHHRSGASER